MAPKRGITTGSPFYDSHMNKLLSTLQTSYGYVIIGNVLFFAALSAALMTALMVPLTKSNEAVQGALSSNQAFITGNSAAEEALYRLKNSYDLGATEELVLGNATATIGVSSGSNEKTILIDAENNDFFRNLEIEASTGAGVSFNYGLQAGRGGFDMAGGAVINGNVHSNGDITGSGAPRITGSAIVANQSNPAAHVMSESSFPPSYEITFGGDSTPTQDVAQSFTVSTTSPLTAVRFNIKRTTTGWMNDIDMYIVEDDGGSPDGSKLDETTIGTSQITTSFNNLTVPLASPLNLTPGNTYWVVLDTSTTWGAHYALAADNNIYANGVAQGGQWSNGSGGSWSDTSPSGLDAYFAVYVGGDTGLIDGITIGESGGEAWAHEVNNSYLHGDLYCQASFSNNQACDTSRPDPAEQPFPVSEGNIEDWKDEAEAGGTISGDVSYSGDDVDTIGPVRIDGDLSVGAGAELYIAGTVYVTGDIDVSGGAFVELDSSYGNNPGVIVSDGLVSMTGGGVFRGNGLPDSYILVLTTSDCHSDTCGSDTAITVSGGTDSVILNAQQGAVEFVGGANANQVTAYEVIMSGGTTVNYISGLADVNFASGPSGSWTIDSWEEI